MIVSLQDNIGNGTLPKTIQYELLVHYKEVIDSLFESGMFKHGDQDTYHLSVLGLPVIDVPITDMACFNAALVKTLADKSQPLIPGIVAAIKRITCELDDVSLLAIVTDLYYQYKHTHATAGIIRYH